MNNSNFNLNWWNYKRQKPNDWSNYGFGYDYNQALKSPESLPQFNNAKTNYQTNWWGRAFQGAKDGFQSFLPSNYSEAGALLGGIGSIWNAISSSNAQKKALNIAQNEYEAQERMRKKRSEEEDALAQSIDNVWSRQ